MTTYQERVMEETKELDAKRERLQKFMEGGVYRDMEYAEKTRLRRQALIMQLYSDVLHERIMAFV